jgi:uncharacterized protein YuzE
VTVSYDKDADVLYITFERLPDNAYVYVENESGDILRLNKQGGRVVGCTIPFFCKRAAQNNLNIPEIGPVPFNELVKALVS